MKAKPFITYAKPMAETRPFRIAAFDTETKGLDGPLLLSQLYVEDWPDARVFPTADDLLACIFAMPHKVLRKTIFYAHNAEYDWRYLINGISKFAGYKVDCRERAAGKFYELRILNSNILTPKGEPSLVTRFRDSMAFYAFSLKKFTENFADKEFKKLDIGLGSGTTFNPKNKAHIDYAKNDVKGLVSAIKNFDKAIWMEYKVHVQATSSSTAYQAWLRTIPEGTYYDRQSPTTEAFLRKCYHGGVVSLNALLRKEYSEIRPYDINSSYPASMKLGVPKGKGVLTYEYQEGLPGFYHVIATVPDDAILPIVPFRSDKGQLAWQTGNFDSYLSSIEIEYCKTLGCKFEVKKGVFFPEGLCQPFNLFVNRCEILRLQYKGEPTEIVIKLMQNSLYGRFGMREDGRECTVDFEGQPDDMEAIFNPETNETIPHAYYKNVIRETEYMLPHWAAWITANSRILIDRATEAAGRENVVYRDTDSVHVAGPITPELEALRGTAYGLLKAEGIKRNVCYHAPKCYTYTDEKGIKQATYKGIPHNLLDMPKQGDKQYDEKLRARTFIIEALHSGDDLTVEFHSSTSLQTMLRSAKFGVERTRKPTDPTKVYGHIIEDGKFRPRRAEQWQAAS
jgi:DNA polymerase type B, organellar and viral